MNTGAGLVDYAISIQEAKDEAVNLFEFEQFKAEEQKRIGSERAAELADQFQNEADFNAWKLDQERQKQEAEEKTYQANKDHYDIMAQIKQANAEKDKEIIDEEVIYTNEKLLDILADRKDTADRVYAIEKDLSDKKKALLLEEAAEEARLRKENFDATLSLYNAITDIGKTKFQNEIIAAGDNAEEIAKIREREFKYNKLVALSDVAINTAIAISRVIPNPVAMGIASAAGAVQAGIIAAKQPPAFADGGIVAPSPGGTIARVAEAGQAEVIFPLDKLDSFLDNRSFGSSGTSDNMINLVVEMDSGVVLQKIFPATQNGTVRIAARAVI
jgi:hypothetical protein